MRLRAVYPAFFFVPLFAASTLEGCGHDSALPEAVDAAADAGGDGSLAAVDAAIGEPCVLGAHVCQGTTPLMCEACGPAAPNPGGQCPGGGSGTVWVGEEACNVQIKGAICVESAAGVGCGCPDGETSIDGGCVVADAGGAPDAAVARDGGKGADAGTATDGGAAADGSDAADAGDAADAAWTTDAAHD